MIGHLYGSFYFRRFPLGDSAWWFCTVIILQSDPCKIFLSRTMHHINKKFNLWKLGIYRILVIKENLLQKMSVESCETYNEVETPIHIGPDNKLLTARQNLYNTSHILYAIIYWTFFENTMEMRLELLLKWKRNMFQFFYGTFLNFVKYCYDISKKIDCCSQLFKLPRMPAWML